MGQLSVTINGRDYSIACDDGQEEHLTRLSDYLNSRISELVAAVGQVGDTRLLVMLGLLIADELSDAFAELAAARGEEGVGDIPIDGRKRETMEDAAVAIETLAERMEAIAGQLEGT
jgi:cell division protein ZapA